MYCPNCGNKNAEQQKFCRSCGLGLEKVAQSLIEQLPTKADRNLQDRKERLERLGVALLSVFGVAVFSFILYNVFNGLMASKGLLIATLATVGGVIVIACGLLPVILFAKAKELSEASNKRQIEEAPNDASTGKLLDPHTEPYFHNQSRFGSYKTGPLRGRNTTLAVTLTPVALYLAGLAKQSTYTRNTGLLAAEGLVGTQVVSFVMKQAVGRLKPSDIPEGGNLRDTWFKYKGGLSNGGGFPSGHTASAFAVATVIAERYHEHRWVPWAAYGTALVLSLSRLPAQAHFSSDIFIGAAMGYSFSHFVVLRK